VVLVLLQYRLQQIKLLSDNYERRLRVYSAIRDFIAVTVWESKVTEERFHAYRVATSDIDFLFSPAIVAFNDVVSDKGYDLMFVTDYFRGDGPKDPIRFQSKGKEQDELLAWFQDQQKGKALADKFRSEMQLTLHAMPRGAPVFMRELLNDFIGRSRS
jgi:hypothetical protein